MLACVDVDYRPSGEAAAACVLFDTWTAAAPCDTRVAFVDAVASYRPGLLFERELPCLLAVLALVGEPIEIVIVDAYVTLDPAGRPGLGRRLFDALGGSVAVVGVAKTPFTAATHALPVLRGESRTPLFVTAIGTDVATAAARVREMAGRHRIPTLLGAVDRLARTAPRA